MAQVESQCPPDLDLEENTDTFCNRLKELRAEDLSKYQETIQKYYQKSNARDKMFILLASLVNNHVEAHKNIITSDSKLEKCNFVQCNIEDIKRVIVKLFTKQGQLKMDQLFIFVMVHKKHWISIFVETLSQLIVHKEQQLIDLISHHPCVTCVWPAVLSALWEQHSSHPDIFQLSQDTLQRCDSSNTALFSRIEEALCRAERFVQWLHCMESFQRKTVKSDQLLHMFSKHSVLYIVNEHLNICIDNISQIRQYIVENAGSTSWEVALFDAYSILYHTTLLLIDAPQLTQEAFAKQLQDILETHTLPYKSKLEISESILSLLFLKRDDLKQTRQEMNKTDNLTRFVTRGPEDTQECHKDEGEPTTITSPETSDVNFVVDNVDKLKIVTSTLQTYLTNDSVPSELQPDSCRLLDNLEEISWKTLAIQQLIRKSQGSLNLGDHLFGRTRADLEVAKSEHCPVSLLLSSAQDFAKYCIIRGDLTRAVEVIERYHLENTEEGRQIFAMKQYNTLLKTIACAPPHDTHLVALREVDNFLALCPYRIDSNFTRLTILLDILSTVAMNSNESQKLLALIHDAIETYGADLSNFSSLLAQLKQAQSELTQCIRDDLVRPSTSLVDFIASGSSHVNLLFWRSLETVMKKFSATEPRRLEEYFVMLVNVIKQSPYLDLDRRETEETKPFSSRIQKMFLHLSSIDSMMADHKGNLLSCVDQDLTRTIGESLFIRQESIASLDLPFVNLAYHAVNYCTGSIPLKCPHECLSELIVLNQCGEPQTANSSNLSPEDTLRDLLSSLLALFKPDDVIDLASASRLAQNERTRSVTMATQQLSRVDLGKYMQGEDATVFLINLYNLMWVHALLTLETSDKPAGLVSRSATCRFLTKRLVAYHLGQTGPVTLHHIEAILLHNFPHVFGTLVDPDSNSSLCPSEPMMNPLATWNITRDPRTVFVLGNAYLLSPLVQVLSLQDNLDLTLERCMSQYAVHHITLSQNCLHVPLLVFHYLEYVTSIARPECEHSNSSDSSSNQSRETRVALIEFVKEYTPVRSFILSRKDVHVLDEIRFNIKLSYADQTETSVSSTTSDVMRIDSHVLDYVVDKDALIGGILASLAKANAVAATTPKSSKDKRSVQSPPADSPEHTTSSIISDRLEQLCSNSRRVQLLSLLTTGKDSLLCFLNWNANLEAVWATVEQEMGRRNFVLVLEILYYVLTPRVFMEDVRLRLLYDRVLLELAPTCDSYILDVTSLPTIADYILNSPNVSSLKCLQYLAARHAEIDPVRAAKVDRQFFLTKLNHEITQTCGLNDWSITEDSNPYEILKKIILSGDSDLAQRWCVYKNLPRECDPDLEVLELYVVFLLSTQRASLAEELCDALSTSQLEELCTRLIASDCDVTHVKVIVNRALSRYANQSDKDYERYMCTVIGVDMLSLMNSDDQKLYRHLIGSPYLIIEQLVLLTRLSLLEKILTHIKPYLIPSDAIPETIPAGRLLQSEIDALLRTYATKALDFRICDVTTSRTILRRSDKLLSSFSPPRTPPSKDDWIPNDECTECMVCRVTIFSMFNRRHHCRRCGRLVCGACSENRMKVSGYGGVAVRVCTQCHAYSVPRSLQLEVTCLSPTNENAEQSLVFRDSPAHNETLREEFSYEYAPSVSLCLSILRFHSQNTTLAMYLCETCTGLLHVMKPSSREIDYSFVIRMIKCLVLACKVIYDVHSIESSTLDEIIAQVNLLSILVNNNCCHLIPEKPLVGQNALRQLRDSLLREERWSLALEVSTKAGLDYNSVRTVWGKACLRAGAWTEARSIFAKCHFDKRENSTLIDILQILQNDMHNGGNLASRLSKLKSPAPNFATENASYSECLYYLHTYGSDALILAFYVNRESLRQALDYVRDNRVSPELFVEHVFLRCLKRGMTEQLYSLMEETDSSLLAWRHYLRAVCAHCERHSLLHSLYAIQIRTRDPVRAAITCVLFYLKQANSYAQLHEKAYQLVRARGHLNDYRAQKAKLEHHLAMHISSAELNKQLVLLDYQTRLVSTIVSTNQELSNRSSSKVATLFGGVEEKAELLADILALEEGGYSEGRFRCLCRETVSALGLNPVSIYCELFKLLARQGRVLDIKHLVAALKQSLGAACDDVLVAAIRQKPPQVEQLISVVSKIPLQISLFTETGKLKSAYLLSVKHDRVEDIRLIASRARALNQTAILNICLKKLALEDAKEANTSAEDSQDPAPISPSEDLPQDQISRLRESSAQYGGGQVLRDITSHIYRLDPSGSGSKVNSKYTGSNNGSSQSPWDNSSSQSPRSDPSDTNRGFTPNSSRYPDGNIRPGNSNSRVYSKTVSTGNSSPDASRLGTFAGSSPSTSNANQSTIERMTEIPRTSTVQNTQPRVTSKKVRTSSPPDESRQSGSKTDVTRSPSSRDRPESYDSISSVLKMYEQNRLKVSQPSEVSREVEGSRSSAQIDPLKSQRNPGGKFASKSSGTPPSDRIAERVITSQGSPKSKSSLVKESSKSEILISGSKPSAGSSSKHSVPKTAMKNVDYGSRLSPSSRISRQSSGMSPPSVRSGTPGGSRSLARQDSSQTGSVLSQHVFPSNRNSPSSRNSPSMRNSPSSENAPNSADSIASVLKRYKLNRLRESQMTNEDPSHHEKFTEQ